MEGRLIEKGPAPRVVSRRAVGLFGFKRFGNYCSGLKRDGSDCRLRQRRGKRDKFFLDALLPCQLAGLDTLVRDLTIRKIDAGHFSPWEAPEAVTQAMREWLGVAR